MNIHLNSHPSTIFKLINLFKIICKQQPTYTMIETIVQVEGGKYPFDEKFRKPQCVKVEEIQTFTSPIDLLEKKAEMLKKMKLVHSPYLIKMLKIYQQELSLHYIYEYVPVSLKQHLIEIGAGIGVGSGIDQKQIAERSYKLFVKRVQHDLTYILSCLVNLRIQVDLTAENIGVGQEDKIKLFMGSNYKIGTKSDVSLIQYYANCKEKILQQIESQFISISTGVEKKEGFLPNFVIKGNKLIFPTNQKLSQSLYDQSNITADQENDTFFGSSQNSGIFNNSHRFSASGIQDPSSGSIYKKSNLRQTQSPCFNRSLNFSQSKNKGSSRSHKNSFQFGNNSKVPNKDKYSSHNKSFDDDNSDTRSFTHSKAIRIELQQKIDANPKKQRKDSYKLKITTFHEYEMDDCKPQDLFGSGPHQRSQRNPFSKERKQNEFFNQFQASQSKFQFVPPSPKNMRRQSQPETMPSTVNFEEKIRMAKEKAQSVLNQYLKSKKKPSFGI